MFVFYRSSLSTTPLFFRNDQRRSKIHVVACLRPHRVEEPGKDKYREKRANESNQRVSQDLVLAMEAVIYFPSDLSYVASAL